MKKLVIVLVCLFAIVLLIGLAFCLLINFDFSRIKPTKFETNTFEVTEKFEAVDVTEKTGKINFLPSADVAVKVVCFESEKIKHTVAVEDGVLKIDVVDGRDWFDYFTIFFGAKAPEITVYLPSETYYALSVKGGTGNVTVSSELKISDAQISLSTGNVDYRASSYGGNTSTYGGNIKIKTSTGGVRIADLKAKSIDVTVSTGSVTVSSAKCDNLTVNYGTGKTEISSVACSSLYVKGSTGKLALKDTVATLSFDISATTGSVTFDKCDAHEITVSVSTGNVSGTLLTPKVFTAKSNTGKVNVPSTATGGSCSITTVTGDIDIKIVE